jgi:hypothetical protein
VRKNTTALAIQLHNAQVRMKKVALDDYARKKICLINAFPPGGTSKLRCANQRNVIRVT